MKIIGSVGRMWSDVIYSQAADSITEMLQFSQMTLCRFDEMILFNKAAVSYHELGRNQLVEEMEGDWLLQVDTDHVFSPDLLVRLLAVQKKYDAPVVSAIYQYKHAPHGPVAALWTGDKTLTPITEWNREAETLEVGAVGAGALLVRKDVFKRIKSELGEAPFQITEGLSEDYSFCRRCRKLGIPVTLATQVEAHHLIRHALSIHDYAGEKSLAAKASGGIVVSDS
jgi:hypothetical protein